MEQRAGCLGLVIIIGAVIAVLHSCSTAEDALEAAKTATADASAASESAQKLSDEVDQLKARVEQLEGERRSQ